MQRKGYELWDGKKPNKAIRMVRRTRTKHTICWTWGKQKDIYEMTLLILGQCLLSMPNNLKETRWRYSGVRFKIQNIAHKLLISTISCDIIKLVGRFLPPVHHLFSHLLHTDGVAAIVSLPLLCEIYAARVNQPKNPGRRVAPSMRQSKLSQSTRG